MRLYVWRPIGHGQFTFVTVSKSLEDATAAITKHIHENYIRNGRVEYEAYGWDSDHYEIEVYEPGQVAENDNE